MKYVDSSEYKLLVEIEGVLVKQIVEETFNLNAFNGIWHRAPHRRSRGNFTANAIINQIRFLCDNPMPFVRDGSFIPVWNEMLNEVTACINTLRAMDKLAEEGEAKTEDDDDGLPF